MALTPKLFNVKAYPKIIHVKEGFGTIQEAINNANVGDTIIVPAGTYYEHVIVNKTVSLIGENETTTIIDGSGTETVVQITAENVSISHFKIQNSGWGWYRNGIYVYRADNCKIENNYLFNNCHNIRVNVSRNSIVSKNTIQGTGYGIRLMNSVNCTAADNTVSGCIGGIHLENATNCVARRNYLTKNDQGIRLYSPCTFNKIIENMVYNNNYDGMIETMPPNATFLENMFFHNNFINNTHPISDLCKGSHIWDDGYPSGGNYWSRYNGTDLYGGPYQNETGSDGIGDIPYFINSKNVDQYPLMHPWSLLPVHNINSRMGYNSIQEAIDASETVNGHTLWVDSGVYQENVIVYKSLTLLGEDKLTTIIDSDKKGTVLSINADNVSVTGFTIRNSGLNYPPYGMDCGVFLNHTTGSSIRNCLITNNRIGIYLFYSKTNLLEHNIVSSNHEDGIWLWYSGNNLLTENEILNNSYNFGVFGGSFSDFSNTIETSNTVDGKPIKYLIGVKNETFDNETNIGVLYLINCHNVTIRDLNLTRNGHGVFCYNVTDFRIENVTASENNYGIYLQDSVGNIIRKNPCSNNWVGICLQDSNHNVVENNIAAYCEKGISLYKADNNIISGNTLRSNLYGIRLFSSNLNEVFHNNLIENTEQVSLYYPYKNVWDNGFEGNFWSNYNGYTNLDGLGDASQIIDDNNRDRYPLLGPFCNFSVYEEGNLYEVTVISNSTILSFIFENSNHTIRLTVNGTDETYGFCRICIPHALIQPEISVIIDNGLTELLYSNYTIRDDGSCRWIYFLYQHSLHEVLIISEFWPVISFSFLIVAILWCSLIKRFR
jgi:parallel beta-helix repeat protein